MSYPMIHLCVAKKVLEQNPDIIENLPQFYLGSLAPDSVHFRENFDPELKKITHLCDSDEKWGEVSNTDEWIESVLTFLKNYKKSENKDFIYGYCTHILTDIRNAIDFWIPFKMKLHNTLGREDVSAFFSEARKESRLDEINTDERLYIKISNEIEGYLSKSKGIDIECLINADEVNRLRDNILYNQYKNISPDTSYVAKYVSYKEYLDFIDRTAVFVDKNMAIK